MRCGKNIATNQTNKTSCQASAFCSQEVGDSHLNTNSLCRRTLRVARSIRSPLGGPCTALRQPITLRIRSPPLRLASRRRDLGRPSEALIGARRPTPLPFMRCASLYKAAPDHRLAFLPDCRTVRTCIFALLVLIWNCRSV